ncbi:MAG: trypsin-like peptidase domain-containing protein [Clostridia bacterium]|nr:trypsin-like peptidase domain-containing protein [Clostridia bacterium]
MNENFDNNYNENLNSNEETKTDVGSSPLGEAQSAEPSKDDTGYYKASSFNDGGTRSYFSNPDTVSSPYPEKPKKKGSAGLIIACVVIVVLLCTGAYFAGRYFGNNGVTPPVNGEVTKDQTTDKKDEVTASDETLAYSDVIVQPNEMVNIVEKTVDCVVEIKTEKVVYGSIFGQSVSQGAGSGVIVTHDGFIVTNNHVIDGAEKVTVRLRSGDVYDAVIWGVNTKNDLAVIKIEAQELSTATFGNSDNLKVGQTVIAIGNPLGELGGSVTSGIVSALAREIKIDNKMMTLIQTDAPVNPGNSGGALFNMAGELIGVVNAKSSGSDVEGIGFAIPSNTAYGIVQDIIANKSSTDKAYLGVEIGQTRQGYVYITKVVDGYDAQKSGLKVNDIIFTVDGTMISSPSTLSTLIASYCVGDTAEMVIYRDGKSQIITVEFTVTRPAEDN